MYSASTRQESETSSPRPSTARVSKSVSKAARPERTRAAFPLLRTGGQGRGRTADLPLFRITDHRAGPAMVVYLPAQRPAVHADGLRCTWMYETRNETGQALWLQ